MAAGRPVLYIGPAAATPALLIASFDCGWHFECGDVNEVLDLLKHLSAHPEEIRKKGENARKAFADGYDKPAGVARICRVLGLDMAGNLLRRTGASCLVKPGFDQSGLQVGQRGIDHI
jgi:hypothetical protein